MTKVFIVDDHKILIDGIIQTLREKPDIEIVGFALSGKDAIEILTKVEADVVLLDIQLPDIDGIDLCKILHKQYPTLKIISLTSHYQASFISAMMKNGAAGYLFKNTDSTELLTAIEAVMAGKTYLSPDVQKQMFDPGRAGKNEFIPRLTRREKEVLALILKELTTQVIAKTLFLSVSSVEKYRMTLCDKLDARNTAGLVKNAIKFGLI